MNKGHFIVMYKHASGEWLIHTTHITTLKEARNIARCCGNEAVVLKVQDRVSGR